jgi:hypothetical protein
MAVSADIGGTAAPSHELNVSALEAAVIHVVGQSRAFLHFAESALREIGSLHDERAAIAVEALQLTDSPAHPGSVRHLERAASALLRALRQEEGS